MSAFGGHSSFSPLIMKMNFCAKIFLLVTLTLAASCAPSRGSKDCMYKICEHVSNYPEDKITNIIKRHTDFHSYFGGSVISPAETDSFDIIGRINGEEPTSVCTTRSVSIQPKIMEDIDGNNRTIPNVKQYTQILKYETCMNNHGPCVPVTDFANHKFYCVQKFTDVTLVTVNVEHGSLEHGRFRVPSTCVCKYTIVENDD